MKTNHYTVALVIDAKTRTAGIDATWHSSHPRPHGRGAGGTGPLPRATLSLPRQDWANRRQVYQPGPGLSGRHLVPAPYKDQRPAGLQVERPNRQDFQAGYPNALAAAQNLRVKPRAAAGE